MHLPLVLPLAFSPPPVFKGVLKIEEQQRGQSKLGLLEISPAGQDVERARQRRSEKVKKGQSSETTKRKKKKRGVSTCWEAQREGLWQDVQIHPPLIPMPRPSKNATL